MSNYFGIIKTKAQALALATKLEKENGSQKALDAAKMLRNNWHYIVARPAIQPELIALANSTPLHRKNSIVNKIIEGEEKMTIEKAKRIIGNQATWALKNMVKALKILPRLNTPEDNERLEAAQIILRSRREK